MSITAPATEGIARVPRAPRRARGEGPSGHCMFGARSPSRSPSTRQHQQRETVMRRDEQGR
jgi:hypothetical protein